MSVRIAITNYGMGNLMSVQNAFESMGVQVFLAERGEELKGASAIVLPGVGAFGDGMTQLKKLGFVEALNEEVLCKKKPFLGICLGMQLIARGSEEFGHHDGLGWISASVRRIRPSHSQFKVPHMGWNEVRLLKESSLYRDVEISPVFYFVHSYVVEVEASAADVVTGVSDHGDRIIASLEQDNIFATQFHPEKSQRDGLQLLKNFATLIEES